jgi:hypothetical protein
VVVRPQVRPPFGLARPTSCGCAGRLVAEVCGPEALTARTMLIWEGPAYVTGSRATAAGFPHIGVRRRLVEPGVVRLGEVHGTSRLAAVAIPTIGSWSCSRTTMGRTPSSGLGSRIEPAGPIGSLLRTSTNACHRTRTNRAVDLLITRRKVTVTSAVFSVIRCKEPIFGAVFLIRIGQFAPRMAPRRRYNSPVRWPTPTHDQGRSAPPPASTPTTTASGRTRDGRPPPRPPLAQQSQ